MCGAVSRLMSRRRGVGRLIPVIDNALTTAPRHRFPRSRLARIRTALVLGVVAATILVGCAPAAPSTAPTPPVGNPTAPADLTAADLDTWLDSLLPAELERTGIAGATVAVVHDGKILTTRGFGYADTGTGETGPVPVDPDQHLFRAGSVSKLVTDTAVLQLVQDGELDLDADVQTYLDFELPRRFDAPLTLRQLMTHTAGFEERLGGLSGQPGVPADLRNALATEPPEQIYPPGTTPAYSNYGNALAGYIVQRVSGMRFEDYVSRNVLARAGMTSSSFEQPLPPELAQRMANGYPNTASPAVQFEIVGIPPAGALSATAPDMARFMLAQLGERVGEGPLLDRATLELMHRPALGADSLGALAEGPRMTLGFFDESRNGHRILGHGGDTQYFHSALQIYPDDGTGIYLSLNSSGGGPLDSHDVRRAVLTGFTDRYFPATGAPQAGAVDAATSADHAATAAGSYAGSRSVHSNFLSVIDLLQPTQVTVQDDGRLLLSPGPLSFTPALYEEAAPWVWREVDGQRILTMRVEDGRVQAIGYDSAFALLPVEPVRSPAVMLPVLASSAVVLLLTILSWPIAAIVRLIRRRPRRGSAGRVARVLTRLAVASTVLALAGWVVALLSIMGLQDVPPAVLRVAQVLQVLALLGVLPAAAVFVGNLRRRTGWFRSVGSALVLLALGGVGWFAVEFMLIAPSVSY
jgi:CubicO group peptidase (beta-lactamase class C family)